MLEFDLVYRQNRGKIGRHIWKKIYPHTEYTMEILDDVFIKINDHLKEFDENKASVTTWLHTIANNKIIDFWRKKEVEKKRHISTSNLTVTKCEKIFQNDSNGSDRNLITNETHNIHCIQANIMIDTICKLPTKYRKIAELRFIDELKYKEISERLDIPIDTIKIQVKRTKEMLIKNSKLNRKCYETNEILNPTYL